MFGKRILSVPLTIYPVCYWYASINTKESVSVWESVKIHRLSINIALLVFFGGSIRLNIIDFHWFSDTDSNLEWTFTVNKYDWSAITYFWKCYFCIREIEELIFKNIFRVIFILKNIWVIFKRNEFREIFWRINLEKRYFCCSEIGDDSNYKEVDFEVPQAYFLWLR